MQQISPWTPTRISSHYLLGLGPEIRRRWQLAAGATVYLRDLGPVALLVPLTALPPGNVSWDEMDAAALRLINTSPIPLSSAPLPAAATAVRAAAPQGTPMGEALAYVNKKGFLSIPDDMKELLGLTVDASFICEVRRNPANGAMCLVISPVKNAAEALTFQQTANERQAARDAVERARAANPTVAPPPVNPLVAQAKTPPESWTVKPGEVLPTPPRPGTPAAAPWVLPPARPMPTETPDAGHVWHQHTDGSWVQVPDMREEA